MSTFELSPISPAEALEDYLQDKSGELTEATLYSHQSRLGHFIRFCEEKGIENMNTLGPREMKKYKSWRQDDADDGLKPVTIKTQMDTLRVFIRWCEGYQAVPEGLNEYVNSPSLNKNQNVRNVKIETEEAEAISEYLHQFHYASTMHVVFHLLWRTMLRRGGLRTLDVDDFDTEAQELTVEHRPDEDTPIKNGIDGERTLVLDTETVRILSDYIEHERHDVTDEYGREPLITTAQGRMHVTTIQNYAYAVTRPCFYKNGMCPHDRDPDECDAAIRKNDASQCPSSVSPHSIRKGAVTKARNDGVPLTIISDRANAGEEVLKKHYDLADEREKIERRRKYFGNETDKQ